MADDDFDFSQFGSFFGLPLPPGIMEPLMKGLILSSKSMRTLYEEHVQNGFSEDQALTLVLSLQRDVVRAVAYVAGELGKVMAPRPPGSGSD